MVNEIDRLLDVVGLSDVRVDVNEGVAADVRDVRQRTGFEVVDADHSVATRQQRVA